MKTHINYADPAWPEDWRAHLLDEYRRIRATALGKDMTSLDLVGVGAVLSTTMVDYNAKTASAMMALVMNLALMKDAAADPEIEIVKEVGVGGSQEVTARVTMNGTWIGSVTRFAPPLGGERMPIVGCRMTIPSVETIRAAMDGRSNRS